MRSCVGWQVIEIFFIWYLFGVALWEDDMGNATQSHIIPLIYQLKITCHMEKSSEHNHSVFCVLCAVHNK